MNLRVTLLFFLFLPYFLQAQITIEASDLPEIGDNFAIKLDTTSYAVSASGPNQVWDFSNLILIDSFSNVLAAPDSCLNTEDFPMADFCLTSLSGDGSRYFSTTGDGLEGLGFVLENWFNLGDYSALSDPTDLMFPVPLTYDTSYVDSTAFVLIQPPFFPGDTEKRVTISTTRTSSIDGWGTLITPTDSEEVLRSNQILNQTVLEEELIDSVWVLTTENFSQRAQVVFLSKEGFNLRFIQFLEINDPSIVNRSNWFAPTDFENLGPPVAEFGVEFDQGQGATTLILDDQSTNWPTSIEWTANGEVIGTFAQAIETYFENTVLEICLTVANNAGSDQICKTVEVEILEPIFAFFSYTETPPFSGNFSFTDMSISATPLSYFWLIDDVDVSTEPSFNYQFTSDGTYNVCLIIEDEFQQFGVHCEDVVVTLGSPPLADFNFDRLTDPTVQYAFTDASTNDPTSWLWDFGDGNTSIEQNPTHVYTADSMFTVCLTATNDFGSDENCLLINVNVQTNETDFPEEWKLFPNPVVDQLTLQFSETIPYNGVLEIFNATGQKVLRQNIEDNLSIDTKSMAPGTYIISIINADGSHYVNRFIKL